MYKEMDDVYFVRMVFNACGKKEVEVETAAIKPVTEIQFIWIELIYWAEVATSVIVRSMPDPFSHLMRPVKMKNNQ